MKFKLLIDVIMTIFMLFLFAYQLTGNTIHEIIGIVLLGLVILHQGLNRKWYKYILKGKYTFVRSVSFMVNILLLVIMIINAVTGIMISRDIFVFLNIQTGYFTRILHTSSSNWGLVFISIHIGLHWSIISGDIYKVMRLDKNNIVIKIISRIVSISIAVCGIYALKTFDMISKLFMKTSFSYWNFEEQAFLFFVLYMSIMGLYIFITFYTFKFISIIKRRYV